MLDFFPVVENGLGPIDRKRRSSQFEVVACNRYMQCSSGHEKLSVDLD